MKTSRTDVKSARALVSVGALTLLALWGLLALNPPPARAATCVPVGTALNITVLADEAVTITRSGNNFVVLGGGNPPCSGATVTSVDAIAVTGSIGSETVTIDLSSGAFEPGATLAGDAIGTPEIEVAVSLAGGSLDTVIVVGSSGSDTYVLGTTGMNLNGDDDGDDITITSVEVPTLDGSGNGDSLSANGGSGTGTAFTGQAALNGGSGSDQLTGGSGNDTLDGGADIDDLNGGAGADTENGGTEGDFFLQGTSANGGDTLNGGGGIDSVQYDSRSTNLIVSADDAVGDGAGGENDNVKADVEKIISGSGADTLSGASGVANTLDGGGGTDRATYAAAPAAVTVNLGSSTASDDGSGFTDTLTSIENATGSGFNDSLTGSIGANALDGGAGGDSINGGDGVDALTGGSGADTFQMNAAPDGADTLTGNTETDTVNYGGRAANLSVSTSGGADDGASGELDNVGSDVEQVQTGSGNDTLAGAAGTVNVLDGGGGSDTVSYATAGGAVTLDLEAQSATNDGGGQADTLASIEHATGSGSADTLTGSSGGNTISGGAGADIITGAGGADVLTGGPDGDTFEMGSLADGADDLDGGGGTDIADYSDRSADLVLTTAGGASDGASGENDDLGSDIETVLSGSGEDTLGGISGTANTLNGGAGNDTVTYAAALGTVTVDLAASDADPDGGGAVDVLTSLENIIGSDFGDTLRGSSANNLIRGGMGGDALIGGPSVGANGDDDLRGEDGSDTFDNFLAADGADAISGGDGTDTITYQFRTANLSVTADGTANDGDISLTEGDNVGSDVEQIITGAGVDVVGGAPGVANTLDGGGASDTVTYTSAAPGGVDVSLGAGNTSDDGGGAVDTLTGFENATGSNQADTLAGKQAEINVLDGGGGTDTVTYAAATAGVIVDLGVGSAPNDGGATLDTLSSIENATGSDFVDTLTGSSGGNALSGGLSGDTITGAAGIDTLNGGDGGDTFPMGSASDGADVVSGGNGTDHANYSGRSANLSVTANGTADDGQISAPEGDNVGIDVELITTGSGADTLGGESGVANTLDGGEGSNTVTYAAASPGGVTMNLGAGTASNDGDGAVDTLTSIGSVTGSPQGDTFLMGSADDGAQGFVGGGGADLADYSGRSANLSVTANGTADDGKLSPTEGDNVAADIEQITTGSGVDTLGGASGVANTLDGGADANTVTYAGASPGGVTINLGAGTASNDGGGAIDALTSISSVTGSPQGDTFLMGSADDGPQGFAGAGGTDLADYGNRSADLSVTADGTADDGKLSPTEGDNVAIDIEQITTGSGTDTLGGKSGVANTLDGGGGTNTVTYAAASPGGVTINLGAGTASNDGGSAADALTSISSVTGSPQGDTFLMGSADDGAQGFAGAGGTDLADYSGRSANLSVTADGIADDGKLSPTEGDDVAIDIEQITTGSGTDTLGGRSGVANTLDGGGGTNTVTYAAASPGGVTINLGAGTSSNDGGSAADTLISVGLVTGSPQGDTFLMGSADDGAQGLSGGDGTDHADYSGRSANLSVTADGTADDGQISSPEGDNIAIDIEQITTGSGTDILGGRQGVANALDGGGQTDRVTYADAPAGVTLNLGGGSTSNDGGSAVDTLTSLERVTGSAFADTFQMGSASDAAQEFVGGAGSDVADYSGRSANLSVTADGTADDGQITAPEGDNVASDIEQISTGSGADTLGGAPAFANTLDGGANTDTATFAGAPAGVNVDLGSGSASNDGGAAVDTLVSIQSVTGSAFADTLAGLSGVANTLDGANGSDTVTYANAPAGVTVNLGAGTASDDGGTASDTLVSFQAVVGSGYGDTFEMGSAVDDAQTFAGGGGSDLADYGDRSANLSVTANGSADDGQMSPTEGDDVGADVEQITTGSGADTLGGAEGTANTLDGGGDTNTVTYAAATGGITVDLGAGSTSDDGGTAIDTLVSIAAITGSPQNDSFEMGSASDGAQTFAGAGGSDLADYSNRSADLSVTADGTADDGQVTAPESDNVGTDVEQITTGSGIDTLGGAEGLANTLNGGLGSDAVSYTSATAGVTVNLGAGSASNDGGSALDTLTSIQGVVGSGFADTFEMGPADDGAQTFAGAGGTDLADYSGRSASLSVTADGTADDGVLSTTEDDNVASDIENITTGSGADILGGAEGIANALDGGDAADTVTYANAGAGVTVNLGAGSASDDGGSAIDTLISFQGVTGSPQDDTFEMGSADDGAQTFAGAGGSDLADYGNRSTNLSVTADGSANDGQVTAPEGDNVGADVEEITTGSGADTLGGASAVANTLDGGAGANTVTYVSAAPAGVTADLGAGSAANDGGGAIDTLTSLSAVTGSPQGDTFEMGSAANGAQTFAGGAGSDLADYSDRNASLSVSADGNANDGQVTAPEGDNVGADVEQITTGSGIDTLAGAPGTTNTLDGNGGSDMLTYAAAPAGVTADLGAGSASNDGGSATDMLNGLENVTGSSFGDTLGGVSGFANTIDGGNGTDTVTYVSATPSGVTVDLGTNTASNDGNGSADTLTSIESATGSPFADSLTGTNVANALSGGDGNDTLLGAGGSDSLNGGSGRDSTSYASASSGITVNLGAGTVTGGATAALTALEDVTGTGFADTLLGDGNANALIGGAGNDRIVGAGGNDTLSAGAGSDTLDLSGATAGLVVDLTSGSSSGQGTDTISGFEIVTGSRFVDTLRGSAGIDRLSGEAGNDVIDGRGGNDTLLGGTGNDNMKGSAGADVLTAKGGKDALRGGSGNDKLSGGGGKDRLFGNAGNDRLNGGGAKDRCRGGGGKNKLISC